MHSRVSGRDAKWTNLYLQWVEYGYASWLAFQGSQGSFPHGGAAALEMASQATGTWGTWPGRLEWVCGGSLICGVDWCVSSRLGKRGK
jgi:hypothetical protein